MTEAVQYSKEILLESLQKLSQTADNSIRATIEQNLLSMTGHPEYLADTFQIITSATIQGTHLLKFLRPPSTSISFYPN